ncbi:MAG TPA: pilus assembly protein TadG-related protein [Actinospica sp.]|nr:pilus assembly protein TadG-related protein [Actinospica sp.]
MRRLRERLRERYRSRRRDESGSVAFIVIMWSVVVVALAALVIDGSLMISQKERAADLAAQAARAQAENLNPVLLREKGEAEIELDSGGDPCLSARQYLSQNTIHDGTAYLDTGAPSVQGAGCALVPAAPQPDNSVRVCVAVTYTTVLIDLSPIATACATAHASRQTQ